jgi:hypothetical protein
MNPRATLPGSLRRLGLTSNRLGPVGAAVLARCRGLARFTALDLDFARLGNDGAAVLAGSSHLAGLRRLDLSGNEIGPSACHPSRSCPGCRPPRTAIS